MLSFLEQHKSNVYCQAVSNENYGCQTLLEVRKGVLDPAQWKAVASKEGSHHHCEPQEWLYADSAGRILFAPGTHRITKSANAKSWDVAR